MLLINIQDMMLAAPNISSKSTDGGAKPGGSFSSKLDLAVAGSGTISGSGAKPSEAMKNESGPVDNQDNREEEDQAEKSAYVPIAAIPITTAEQTAEPVIVITEQPQTIDEIPVNVVGGNADAELVTQDGKASMAIGGDAEQLPIEPTATTEQQPVAAIEADGAAGRQGTEPAAVQNQQPLTPETDGQQRADDLELDAELLEKAGADTETDVKAGEDTKQKSQLFSKLTKEDVRNYDNSFVRQAMDEANAAIKGNNVANDYKILDAARPLISAAEAENSNADTEDMGQQPKQAKTDGQPVMTAANAAVVNNFEFKLENVQQAEPILPDQNVRFQIIDRVSSMVDENKQELTLQLKPHHLGGLTITLTADTEGVVAKLVTASKDAHALIQSEMAAMQEVLRDKGVNVVQMEVIYDQMANTTGKGDSNGQGNWNGQTHQSNHGGLQETTDAATLMYDDLSGYDVLTEQGGSVEFSA